MRCVNRKKEKEKKRKREEELDFIADDLTEGVVESSLPSKSFNSYDVTNDVFNRLVENGHEETISNLDFHNHLDSHFNRLPAR